MQSTSRRISATNSALSGQVHLGQPDAGLGDLPFGSHAESGQRFANVHVGLSRAHHRESRRSGRRHHPINPVLVRELRGQGELARHALFLREGRVGQPNVDVPVHVRLDEANRLEVNGHGHGAIGDVRDYEQ